jgi:hypothetical protein
MTETMLITEVSALSGMLSMVGTAVSAALLLAFAHWRRVQRLVVEAVADDGTVEAVRVRDAAAFALAVQWHPEFLFYRRPQLRLFAALARAAARLRCAMRLPTAKRFGNGGSRTPAGAGRRYKAGRPSGTHPGRSAAAERVPLSRRRRTPGGQGARLRRRGSCGPCDDGWRGSPGRHGCAFAGGNRAPCAGDGCSAGTYACSRIFPSFDGIGACHPGNRYLRAFGRHRPPTEHDSHGHAAPVDTG